MLDGDGKGDYSNFDQRLINNLYKRAEKFDDIYPKLID